MDESFEVPADELLEINFTLPFKAVNSNIDEFQKKNILAGGLAKLAKTLSNVKSEYFIEVVAEVEGTALNPFDRQQVIFQ